MIYISENVPILFGQRDMSHLILWLNTPENDFAIAHEKNKCIIVRLTLVQ